MARKRIRNGENMILVSAIIATYNRANFLERLLSDFSIQVVDSRFDFEVIIVDNNSSDQTKTVVESFINHSPERFVYLFEKRQGKSLALNSGIQKAKGDIFAFTDDDVHLDLCWLKNLVECFLQYGCDGVGGKVIAKFPEDAPAWIRANEDLLCGPIVFHDYGEGTKLYQKPMIEIVGANMAFKRTIFDDCGLFRIDLGAGQGTMGEDTELFKRFSQKTKKIYYCGEAIVQHPVDLRRLKLKSIAQWNIALAKYRFIVDENGRVDEKLVFCLGIPRYLIREVAETALSLPFKIFNRREFLKAWIKLSLKLGTISEVRKRNRCAQSA